MIFFINATNLATVTLALVNAEVIKVDTIAIPYHEADFLLSEVLNFFKKNKYTLTDITHFYVASGPGSFTGTRISIALLQGLSMALSKPITFIPNADIPTDLSTLLTLKKTKKMHIVYNRPAY